MSEKLPSFHGEKIMQLRAGYLQKRVIILSYKFKLQGHPNSSVGMLFLNNYVDNKEIHSKYRKMAQMSMKFFVKFYSSALHDIKSALSGQPGATISTISLLQLRGRETRKSDCKCRISAEKWVPACGSYNVSWNLFDRREKRRDHMRGRMQIAVTGKRNVTEKCSGLTGMQWVTVEITRPTIYFLCI
jgi:hypothetical protein